MGDANRTLITVHSASVCELVFVSHFTRVYFDFGSIHQWDISCRIMGLDGTRISAGLNRSFARQKLNLKLRDAGILIKSKYVSVFLDPEGNFFVLFWRR